MSQNRPPRKGSSRSKLIHSYLAFHKGTDPLDCTMYDPSLGMHNLENTLNKTTTHLQKLRKQGNSKQIKEKGKQEVKKENWDPSNFRKGNKYITTATATTIDIVTNNARHSNASLLKLLLKNISKDSIPDKIQIEKQREDKPKNHAHRVSLESCDTLIYNKKNIKLTQKRQTPLVQVRTLKFTGHSHHQSQIDILKNRKDRRLVMRSVPGTNLQKYLDTRRQSRKPVKPLKLKPKKQNETETEGPLTTKRITPSPGNSNRNHNRHLKSDLSLKVKPLAQVKNKLQQQINFTTLPDIRVSLISIEPWNSYDKINNDEYIGSQHRV